MTPTEFKTIRVVLGMSQSQLARVLGYRHAIRVSELERSTNPVPVPRGIAQAMRALVKAGGRPTPGRKARGYERQNA